MFCAEVTEGKTRFFDPQTGKDDASNYIQSMKAGRVGDRPYARGRSYKEDRYDDQ